MPDFELITPFPEADLPAVFHWTQPYLYKTEHFDQSLEKFVAHQRERTGIATWGIKRAGELGGYIEFESQGDRLGIMGLLCKTQFFRFYRQTVVIPALNEALGEVFAKGTDVVLFTPVRDNQQLVNLLRKLGARDAGAIMANGMPEKRVLSIGSGDWVK